MDDELADDGSLDEAGIDELMQQAHESSDESSGGAARQEQSLRSIKPTPNVSRGIFSLAKKVGQPVEF